MKDSFFIKQEFEVGQKVRATELAPWGSQDITVGKVYTIAGRDEDDEVYFIDDAGDRNFAAEYGSGSAANFELVEV